MLSPVQRSSNWALTSAAHPRFRSYLPKGAHARLRFRICRQERHQNRDPAHALRLLRPRHKRPRSRAAESG
jgi:hypothetical protein